MNTKLDDAQVITGNGSIATPITVRINEACRLTGIGRSKLYELIQAGEIEIIKVGTITLVPMASLVYLRRKMPSVSTTATCPSEATSDRCP